MKITIYNQKGENKGDMTLPKEMFEVELNEGLVHRALKRQLSNSRSPIAHTKDRSEVRGGGRKPFRQKGTGRARQGSTRSPINIGGGVTFGPRNTRNFEIQMPKKERRKALFMALSVKAQEKKVFGLDKYEDKDMKTKNAAEMVSKLPVERNVLFVTPEKNETLKRVTNNLPNAKTIQVNYVNFHDLLKYDSVCFVGDSIEKAKELFVK
ncbi:MAG: 50S ribosomal protein L4 [Magnetovibrio sp.]|nr:50S ribosomal protein L4 [Magnetovibrio sp.]